MDQDKDSHCSESFSVRKFFGRRRKMSMKSVLLMSFLALALAFGGLVDKADATIDGIETIAFDGDDTNDDFGMPGIEVILNGDTDENSRDDLGTLQIMKQETAAEIDGVITDLTVGVFVPGDDVGDVIADLDAEVVHDALTGAFGLTADATVVRMTSGERWLVLDPGDTGDPGSETGDAYLLVESGGSLTVYIPLWINIYERHLDEVERAFLMIFSVFRTPVDTRAFTQVFQEQVECRFLI